MTDQEANRPKCLRGTRVDLLQKIREWASASDRPNIFLLTGALGAGKSTVARTIAEEFKEQRRLGCYICFEGGKADSSVITSTVIQTIAYNLARKSSIIAKNVLKATTSYRHSNLPSTDILFRYL